MGPARNFTFHGSFMLNGSNFFNIAWFVLKLSIMNDKTVPPQRSICIMVSTIVLYVCQVCIQTIYWIKPNQKLGICKMALDHYTKQSLGNFVGEVSHIAKELSNQGW